VKAQADVFPQVLAELGVGEKRSHWIWFIFPQMKGGAQFPGGVLRHWLARGGPSLCAASAAGSRLVECTRLVNQVEGGRSERFSATLTTEVPVVDDVVARAAEENAEFDAALKKYFDGEAIH